MHLAEALEHWRDFYLLVGTAGATLVALLFVTVSIAEGSQAPESQLATRTFMSPVVIHFTAVFFLSAVALVPAHRAPFFATLIGATALVGLAVCGFVVYRVIRPGVTDYMQDRLAYGILPVVAYVALLAAAALIVRDNDWALDLLAGALLLLTIVNIRNAWDLVLAMARRRGEQH